MKARVLTENMTYMGWLLLLWKVVAPKKARLAEAEASLAETMEILNAKRQELNEVEAKLANLKLTFGEMTEKKQQLEFQVWEAFIANRESFFNNPFGSRTQTAVTNWNKSFSDLDVSYVSTYIFRSNC